MTAGCVNPTCGQSMGGTYVNGVKVRTASGRSLVPEPTAPCATCGGTGRVHAEFDYPRFIIPCWACTNG
jgi:hypothetical protein